jgi:hypothetical protein
MRLTAVYEHWHLGDGNYPAFAVGDEVRLSFELDVDEAAPAPPGEPEAFERVRDAEYVATARVIQRYPDGISATFPVFEAAGFRFYSPFQRAGEFPVGSIVRLRGTLVLDHYQWVEFLGQYSDPPDLFYNLRVARIRRIAIPARFIQRSTRTVVYPTSVGSEDYSPDGYEEVQGVEEGGSAPAFSLIDFESLPAGTGPVRPSFFGA